MAENNKIAIVRDIANSYANAVTMFHHDAINVELAKDQHQKYCETLEALGLELIRIPADDSLPDCCFPEDPAIIIEDVAIICNLAAQSRIPETVELEKVLANYKKIEHIKNPGTIDGGDVLFIEKKIFIGLSKRTNEEGIKQVEAIANPLGYEIIPVKIWNILHLKSFVTHVGDNCIIIAEGYSDITPFNDYDKIIVPKDEEYCANVLNVNGKVIIPSGFPKTKALIEGNGFEVIELDMSEIEKAEGALTCLSKIF